MTSNELAAAVDRSGLSREEIQQMTRDEVTKYFSVENYRDMFGSTETPPECEMAEIRRFVLEMLG